MSNQSSREEKRKNVEEDIPVEITVENFPAMLIDANPQNQ